MKKAMVTGAAGFIGSHVAADLLAEGVEVRAMVRPDEPTKSLDGLDVEIVKADLLDKAAVNRAVKGTDTVFHLAAIYATWLPDWSRIYEVNLQGSRNVLWSCLNNDVDKVVYTSSIAAIGTRPGKQVANESTPFDAYDMGSHYVLTKYLSQQEALGFAENGLDLTVVNPAFPFGDNDTVPTPTGRIIVDILRGNTRFSFRGGLCVVDVKDVARGHVLAAKKGGRGEKYILGNANLTLAEFIKKVQRIAGVESRILPAVPVPALKALAYGLSLYADCVSHSAPLSTPPDVEFASRHLFYDNTRARDELGLEFTPVEESIERSIRWFRDNGYA
ncbi:MAG: SDR family oxidoreductase [Desulfatibacillaceae bacterium]